MMAGRLQDRRRGASTDWCTDGAKLELMPIRTDTFDLGGLHLTSGGGRRLKLFVAIDEFVLGGERYRVKPDLAEVAIDVSRTTANGFALRLSLEASLVGPCMRCLEPAAPVVVVESREVSQPGEGEDLDSPYLEKGILDVRGWARDALALTMPTQLLCSPDCQGLCPVCGVNLNRAGARHHHERGRDPRWAKLSEIHFD
jgi:uncharacterized protein